MIINILGSLFIDTVDGYVQRSWLSLVMLAYGRLSEY